MKVGFYRAVIGWFCLVVSQAAVAEVHWQSFRVSYLYGEHYRVGEPERSVFTFEHAAGTDWGDSFLFWDHLRSRGGERNNYGEWAPRLSYCKLAEGCAWSDGVVKDALLAGTVEMGETATHFLYGVGVDLNLPGFAFFQINAYRRDNQDVADNWQTTLTWAAPFEIAGEAFLYDGFIDWYSSTEDWRSSLNWTSQLKWALDSHLPIESPLYLGVEYVYWRNKYGIANSAAFPTDESNLNLLLKWHF